MITILSNTMSDLELDDIAKEMEFNTPLQMNLDKDQVDPPEQRFFISNQSVNRSKLDYKPDLSYMASEISSSNLPTGLMPFSSGTILFKIEISRSTSCCLLMSQTRSAEWSWARGSVFVQN